MPKQDELKIKTKETEKFLEELLRRNPPKLKGGAGTVFLIDGVEIQVEYEEKVDFSFKNRESLKVSLPNGRPDNVPGIDPEKWAEEIRDYFLHEYREDLTLQKRVNK